MATLSKASSKEMCRMGRDHYERGNFCIMTDGQTVWLSEQAAGESPTQSFQCSRRMFNFLIAQYQKDRKLVRPKEK